MRASPLLLTVKEVTTILRVQRPKVYELIRDGIITGFKVGADWRIRRDSVELLVGPIPDMFFGASVDDVDDLLDVQLEYDDSRNRDAA